MLSFFFPLSILFFSQSRPIFQHPFFLIISLCSHFFFQFSFFFSQSQPHYYFHFFFLCSRYALTQQSFLFSVFSFLSQGEPLLAWSFFNFFQHRLQIFYSHSFKRWEILKGWEIGWEFKKRFPPFNFSIFLQKQGFYLITLLLPIYFLEKIE